MLSQTLYHQAQSMQPSSAAGANNQGQLITFIYVFIFSLFPSKTQFSRAHLRRRLPKDSRRVPGRRHHQSRLKPQHNHTRLARHDAYKYDALLIATTILKVHAEILRARILS